MVAASAVGVALDVRDIRAALLTYLAAESLVTVRLVVQESRIFGVDFTDGSNHGMPAGTCAATCLAASCRTPPSAATGTRPSSGSACLRLRVFAALSLLGV